MESKQVNIFDDYSDNYHQILNKTLRISGENTSYFASKRVHWLKQRIDHFFPEFSSNKILDFGCGTGDTISIIKRAFNPEQLIGIDLSRRNIELAIQNHNSKGISFFDIENSPGNLNCDLAYCNGVFHHIPFNEREKAVKFVYNSLTREGIWAFWENNPWNPGAKYIMKKCPFDKDAISLSHLESKRLLKRNGFKIVDVSFCFIFPKAFEYLRVLEKPLSILPIGAQYLILAKKV